MCPTDNLDLSLFVIVLEAGTIVSVAIPKISCHKSTAEIVALASHLEYLGKGYGKTAVHIAFT